MKNIHPILTIVCGPTLAMCPFFHVLPLHKHSNNWTLSVCYCGNKSSIFQRFVVTFSDGKKNDAQKLSVSLSSELFYRHISATSLQQVSELIQLDLRVHSFEFAFFVSNNHQCCISPNIPFGFLQSSFILLESVWSVYFPMCCISSQ